MGGYDSATLAMLTAVPAARCGVSVGGHAVYRNLAGGMRVSEPAADLAIAAALVSSREGIALPPDTVVFGEISLSGALRPITQADVRVKEATKLGFSAAFAPSRMKLTGESGMTINRVEDLGGFLTACFENKTES